MSSSVLRLCVQQFAARGAASRCLMTGPTALMRTSLPRTKVETMKQVDVDASSVQQQLGNINMDFVRKAERKNKQRAKMHRFFRRTDWMIATVCFSLVIGIYSYTIYAIQQEKFLDDFEMPEEIDNTDKK